MHTHVGFYVIVVLSENSVYGGCPMEKVILFDVDGVFLDEGRCFDVSALAVYELLFDEMYLNLGDSVDLSHLKDSQIQAIRNDIFENDMILNHLKSLGINSNWDMLFVVFSIHFINLLKQLNEEDRQHFLDSKSISQTQIKSLGDKFTNKVIDYAAPLDFLSTCSKGKEALYEELKQFAGLQLNTTNVSLFDIQSPLWKFAQSIYQEWYLGRTLFEEVEKQQPKSHFKKGYIYHEKPLVPIDEVKSLLCELKEKGYKIAIATGRTRGETLIPFKSLGLLEHFNESHIVTASEVMDVEQKYPDLKPLGKPNPFSYIAALNGNQVEDYYQYATNQSNCVNKEEVTIVGDSLADLICAQKMNAYFIGTLSGLKGQDAREELEKHHADQIVNHVLDIRATFIE